MAASNLEQRMQALEEKVADLTKRLEGNLSPHEPWWEKIAGTFSNDPAYQKAMRLGREWRERENARSLAPKTKRRKKRNVRS